MAPSMFVILLSVVQPLAARPQDSIPPELVTVRALLDSSKVNEAIKLAERYASRHPRDPRGFMAVGEAYTARMPSGRFRAFRAYREAERLDRTNPEIPYRMAQIGLWLGGADGERIAHDGLERVMELDPLYKTAWTDWLVLYRNGGTRRAMIKRLTPFADHPEVKARLALLDIEEEAYADADALLDAALARDPDNVAWLALRAQSALEQGDTARGFAVYDAALRGAHRDSSGALWDQIVGIATPQETQAWEAGVPAGRRGAWIRSFWARRNPDLFAGANPRVLEHFQRLREARKMYPLLHPMLTYHRNVLGRTLNLEPSREERTWNQRCEVYQALPPSSGLHVQSAGASRARDRMRAFGGVLAHLTDEEKRSLREAMKGGRPLPPKVQRALSEEGSSAFAPTLFAPLNLDLRSVDTAAARIGYNLLTGLSDRGLMYLRFGPPERLVLGGDNPADPRCSTNEVERWTYDRWGEVRFAKPSAMGRPLPETVFRPMNEEQFEVMELGLTRDASSEPASLEFGAWTAQFRNSIDPTASDLVVAVTRGAVAATLVGVTGGERGITRQAGGVATLTDRPGEYALLVHAREDGMLGRQQLRVELRGFAHGVSMADLLVVRAWADTAPSRGDVLDRVDPALRFQRGDVLRVYTELYGLASGPRYRVTYSVLETDDPMRDIQREVWPDAVRFQFVRDHRGDAGTAVEWMDIEPRWFGLGTHLLRIETFEEGTGQVIGRSGISFEISR